MLIRECHAMTRIRLVVAGSLLLMAGVSCSAAVESAEPADETVIDPTGVQLQPLQQNGISYLQGGIGIDESRALQQASGYTLHITLSIGPDNKYLAGAELALQSSNGQPLLALHDVGPLVYVKLAPGHYRLVASFEGEQQQHSVQVEAGTATKVNVHWR